MNNSVFLFACLCLCLLWDYSSAHSWLQCADYTEENGRTWSAANCRGWPRNYDSVFKTVNYAFGGDAGYNYQPGSTDKACSSSPSPTTDYTAAYPQATYSPGQQVCIAWPPKNHVAANCNNANIPDHGTRVYRSDVNPTTDPTLTQFHNNLVHDFGVDSGTTGTGFMNCPDFCANNGAALCTGCFQIPTNLPQGKYTFLWEWAFNADTDLYTNCFDVNIVANSGNGLTALYSKVSPDEYKEIKASGKPDVPTVPATSGGGGNDNTSGGTDGGGGGMSPGGAAVLSLFIIALVGVLVGSVLFVKLGYGSIDTTFPFYHRNSTTAYRKTAVAEARTTGNYVAYVDAE